MRDIILIKVIIVERIKILVANIIIMILIDKLLLFVSIEIIVLVYLVRVIINRVI
jgi:hypothetical protein